MVKNIRLLVRHLYHLYKGDKVLFDTNVRFYYCQNLLWILKSLKNFLKFYITFIFARLEKIRRYIRLFLKS